MLLFVEIPNIDKEKELGVYELNSKNTFFSVENSTFPMKVLKSELFSICLEHQLSRVGVKLIRVKEAITRDRSYWFHHISHINITNRASNTQEQTSVDIQTTYPTIDLHRRKEILPVCAWKKSPKSGKEITQENCLSHSEGKLKLKLINLVLFCHMKSYMNYEGTLRLKFLCPFDEV